jgi:hypothetical protein
MRLLLAILLVPALALAAEAPAPSPAPSAKAEEKQKLPPAEVEAKKAGIRAEIAALQARIETLQKELKALDPTTSVVQVNLPPIAMTFEGKTLVKADITKGRIQDFIILKLKWTNNTPKDVRAFKGAMTFKDVLGDTIGRGNWTCEKPIRAGKSIVEDDRGMESNMFSNSDQRLATIKSENLRVEFKLSVILYADGTKEEF